MPEPSTDTSAAIPEGEAADRIGTWWREGGRGGHLAFLALEDHHDARRSSEAERLVTRTLPRREQLE
ncbi:hypothetical protein ACTWJ8_34005 [Streptomyces sp. SDT5-1]|uniref:hypothetical protein n=1 Tax=Streptomyces sp. SDT5-1 TaxID=3406418 RepID=UPI003FD2AF35